jgi:hypothetical protein
MTTKSAEALVPGIPIPIVRLNRWTIVVTLLFAFAVQQPLITTALFLVLLGSVIFGPKGSIVFQVGSRARKTKIAEAKRRGEVEDRRLMRFNNSIAAIMLAAAQIAFLTGAETFGWILAGIVVLAATVALLGFCVGCFIFYRFRLAQFRWKQSPSLRNH